MLIERLIVPALLARLLSCAGTITSIPVDHVYDARWCGPGAPLVSAFVATGENEYVAVTGGSKPWSARQVERSSDGHEEVVLDMPRRAENWCFGEQLVRTTRGWWYTRCVAERDEIVLSFVMGEPPFEASTVSLPRTARTAPAWLPLQGDHPSGVLLEPDVDDQQLRATLIAPGTKTLLGSFTPGGLIGDALGNWQAARLGSGSVAVIGLEPAARSETAVTVRVFSNGEGSPRSEVFRESAPPASLAVAVSGSGKLGIAAVREDGVVLGAVFDPAAGVSSSPQALSGSVRAALPFPGVTLVPAGEGFVAAWVSDSDRAIWLCEFGAEYALPSMRVGEASDPFSPALAMGSYRDGIDCFWVAGNGLFWRRLPEHPSGYLLAAELWGDLRRAVQRVAAGIDP